MVAGDEVVDSVEIVEQVEDMDALGDWLDLALGKELAVGEVSSWLGSLEDMRVDSRMCRILEKPASSVDT